MKPLTFWAARGFVFEAHFPKEYDLYRNPVTGQKLRRYFAGYEWLSDLRTGEYKLITDGDTKNV